MRLGGFWRRRGDGKRDLGVKRKNMKHVFHQSMNMETISRPAQVTLSSRVYPAEVYGIIWTVCLIADIAKMFGCQWCRSMIEFEHFEIPVILNPAMWTNESRLMMIIRGLFHSDWIVSNIWVCTLTTSLWSANEIFMCSPSPTLAQITFENYIEQSTLVADSAL